jgi:hypothetical protein
VGWRVYVRITTCGGPKNDKWAGIPNVDKNRRLVANPHGKTAITMILTSESFGMGGGGFSGKGMSTRKYEASGHGILWF